MTPTGHDDAPHAAAALSLALTEAAEACRETVADYRAGLLDDGELERALRRCGLVRLPGGTWVLDVQLRRRITGGTP